MPSYTAVGSAPPLVWELGLLAEPSQLAIARRRVAETSREFRLDDARTSDLVLAVNEAVTNAIRHGRPDRIGRIRIKALATPERLTFAVSDYGTFVEPRGELDPLSAGGRGFHLMSQLVDEVTVHRHTNGTTVMLSTERT
jgi:anti-sigma regulatory factor (Ser/Thr protein kinase)